MIYYSFSGMSFLPGIWKNWSSCALLPDYYLRTCGTDLSQLPQISQEAARIEDDYEFVRSRVTWQDIAERVARYKEMDIQACV
ncbi:MAG: hypothetical protein K2O97_04880 [Acetatifactor sp.]|nr:hypothetical protein [Acetatifactor sp.]MDE7044340.1 hypothetical protein [Acetatifactor sp.]